MATVGMGYQTGTADPGFYQNQLKNLITNPNSFQGTPGYQFALQQGLNSVNASNAPMRGSGNALVALQNYGSGLAQQNYGNYLNQLGQLSGQAQQYDVGLAGAANTAQGNRNTLQLGTQQNANTLALGNAANANQATQIANQYALGKGQLGLGQTEAANTLALGQGQLGLGYTQAGNQYNLGQGQLANQAQNNWWNYSLGNAQNENQYNLGMYNAGTSRGQAQSNAYLGGQQNALDWYRYGPQQPYWQGNTLFGGRPPAG